MDIKHPHSDLIDALGGTSAVAEIFDIKSPSVSDWRKTGIPPARLMFLKAIRPELFAKSELQQVRRAKRIHAKEAAHA